MVQSGAFSYYFRLSRVVANTGEGYKPRIGSEPIAPTFTLSTSYSYVVAAAAIIAVH